MEELLLKLIEEVRKTYKDKKAADLVFKRLFAAAKESSDYTEAYEFAKRAGHDLEDAIIENWAALMQDSEIFASTAKQLLKGVVPDMNEDILKACEQIQDNKNAAAGMRIKPQTAVANPYDLNTIAKELDGKKMSALDGELATHACKTVDSTERANMDFAMNSGYEIKVKRTYDGVGLRRKTKHAERCSYCLERAGTRTFDNTHAVNSSGIFARHNGCGCTIDYENTSTGTKTKGVQNYKTGIKKPVELRGNAESVKNNLNQYRGSFDNADNVTEAWRMKEIKEAKVVEMNDWTAKGMKYTVDGVGIVQDHNSTEKEIAMALSQQLGGEVQLVPRIVEPKYIQTPDILFRGERFDIKSIEGESADFVFNAVHKKKEQAHNFVIDTTIAKQTEAEIIEGFNKAYNNAYGKWIDTLIWYHDGVVKAVFKRK